MSTTIRMARKKKGLSISELADRAGVSASSISRVERRQANLSPIVAMKISSLFGGRLEWQELFPKAGDDFKKELSNDELHSKETAQAMVCTNRPTGNEGQAGS